MNILCDKINSPADIKELDNNELNLLAAELREKLINTVSKTGGHLASNLGVVELTIAIHKVFDSPKDQIVWDVGHQVYTHKLLTGRFDSFDTLRTKGGISGFPRPSESEHDIFYCGHSSASISAALGLATAKKIQNDPSYSIAVIGDGSFTGGLAFEGLNNAGRSNTKLIVILNDNEMSISKNVGSIARYLAAIRTKPEYYTLMADIEKKIIQIPKNGEKIYKVANTAKTAIKNILYQSTFFEDMGFKYLGPINGHNIEALCEALEGAKALECPVLLHINTVKGKGYDHAEQYPTQFHGISKFDVLTGEPKSSSGNFSVAFGECICDLALKDKRICGITAAMSVGTELEEFSKVFPTRFFDVGLAEEHAVTFSGGLAKDGMIPVFAVYSTFLQRCYDQLVHDAALQRQKIILAVDRAGFVGEDGETHQGILDVAFLNTIPNITVYSPSSYKELKSNFYTALYEDEGVVAVRYPRGGESELPRDYKQTKEPYTIYGDHKAKIVLVTYGKLFGHACEAIKELKQNKINVKILKLNRIKPIDDKAIDSILNCQSVFFFEEGVRSGGVGEAFALKLLENGYKGQYKLQAINDCFVAHASIPQLMEEYGLDAKSMVNIITGSV
ncbi:MAG: 1-deoxy-D-xylulose-5-phosphate synthase [Oscillospiraceae bacterium]